MQLFGTVTLGLGDALKLYQSRHEVLSQNVANYETPGYKAKDLDFQSALSQAFDRDRGSESRPGSPEPDTDSRAVVKLDGNSVDLDTQMAKLSENAMQILTLSRVLSRRYEGLRKVIEGRG